MELESGDGTFESGRFLIETNADFGSASKECGEYESDDGGGGSDAAKDPLHHWVFSHEAVGEEGESEPEAKELGNEGTRAVYRRVLVDAHCSADDGRDREESREKSDPEDAEYLLIHGPLKYPQLATDKFEHVHGILMFATLLGR